MQSIGERLEEARKRKGISIREAAEATKIRGDYLHKYESNQFDIKLPEIYVRGFLRTYANYLKLPADKIINDYNALGLGESKQARGLNREVYGRMDISVGSAKPDKEEKEPATAEPAHPEEPTAPRNPATFIPRATGNAPLDRDLLIKIGALIAAAVIVVLIAVWALFGRSGNRHDTAANSNPPPLANPSSDIIWVKPQPGERMFVVTANAASSVTITNRTTGATLYSGTIPAGESRAVPHRNTINLRTDTPQNITITVDGRNFAFKDGDGKYVTSGDIK